MKTKSSNKNFLYIFLGTAGILSIPLIAMQFTNEVDWKLFDFIVVGTLLLGTGCIYELLSRKMEKHRIIIGMVLLALLFLTWVHLAVGIVDTWPLAGS